MLSSKKHAKISQREATKKIDPWGIQQSTTTSSMLQKPGMRLKAWKTILYDEKIASFGDKRYEKSTRFVHQKRKHSTYDCCVLTMRFDWLPCRASPKLVFQNITELKRHSKRVDPVHSLRREPWISMRCLTPFRTFVYSRRRWFTQPYTAWIEWKVIIIMWWAKPLTWKDRNIIAKQRQNITVLKNVDVERWLIDWQQSDDEFPNRFVGDIIIELCVNDNQDKCRIASLPLISSGARMFYGWENRTH